MQATQLSSTLSPDGYLMMVLSYLLNAACRLCTVHDLGSRVCPKLSRCAQLNMPALLGMLVAGAALQNARAIRLPHQWSAKIRSGGLAVILLRAGLKIDEKAFQRAGFLVARRAAKLRDLGIKV